ncbi:MAG: AfsR/SARP family transcriptional regulator [Acidimicrobiia bacterium]
MGPIDLVMEGRVVVPRGRISRKLLGALAISVNHAISSDRLAEIIWHDNPPPSQANTLQTYVYRLREALGHETIVSEDHSYALMVDPGQLDALEFERMATLAAEIRSDPSECMQLCKQALSLWRGVPFGEFADEDPFRLEAIRLDELRLYVMELKIASALETGREEMVVGTLETLVDDYPYRERLWYLLIEALALCGRRVEALRSFDRLRQLLSDVGLEPSEDIRLLEEEILSEDSRVRPRLQ